MLRLYQYEDELTEHSKGIMNCNAYMDSSKHALQLLALISCVGPALPPKHEMFFGLLFELIEEIRTKLELMIQSDGELTEDAICEVERSIANSICILEMIAVVGALHNTVAEEGLRIIRVLRSDIRARYQIPFS